MKLIVAVDENWGIGKDKDQPYYIPEDLRFFKEKTMGKTIIMGRITYNVLPTRPLKGRKNIVLTRQGSFPDVVTCNSLQSLAAYLASSGIDGNDTFVIGGQKVYEGLLNYCHTAYVTKVFAKADADCFFPNLDDLDNWQLISQSPIKIHDNLQFCFCQYKNNAPKALFQIIGL